MRFSGVLFFTCNVPKVMFKQIEIHCFLFQDEEIRASLVVPSRSYSSTAYLPRGISPPTAAVPRPPPVGLHSELAAVLQKRQNKMIINNSAALFQSDALIKGLGSKRSLDLTDDEDLGLPKSLQNSPGRFQIEYAIM